MPLLTYYTDDKGLATVLVEHEDLATALLELSKKDRFALYNLVYLQPDVHDELVDNDFPTYEFD